MFKSSSHFLFYSITKIWKNYQLNHIKIITTYFKYRAKTSSSKFSFLSEFISVSWRLLNILWHWEPGLIQIFYYQSHHLCLYHKMKIYVCMSCRCIWLLPTIKEMYQICIFSAILLLLILNSQKISATIINIQAEFPPSTLFYL